MLFKRAGSAYWYVNYRDASGRRVKRSTGTTNRREAEELEGKWRLESRQKRLWGTQPRYTFDELMLRYLKETQSAKRSAERDAWTVKQLQPYFAGKVLNDLKRSDVRGYVAKRRDAGVKGSTINREVGLFSAALNVARLDWDWDIPNPAQGMREPEPEGRKFFLTEPQFNALMSAAGRQKRAPYLADLVVVAVMTGCRKGELLGLEWERVDFEANVIRLRDGDTKAGKSRLVPLNAAAREALQRRLQYRQDRCPEASWVFCGPDGERIHSVKSSFRHAYKSAGIAHMRFHDLRHTCGSWLVQAGVPEGHVAQVLGHSTVRMTERYAHLAPANARAAVEKIAAGPKRIPSAAEEQSQEAVSA
ncbi:MAG TPA: site-specific integrase [Burkholderiales bacterium]|nr:site-specific integrase [Burkholderiales bacterium]